MPNVLSRVTVDTASSGTKNENGLVQHELNLAGLKDPHGFKKLVWAMKRGDHPDTVVKSTTMNNQSLSLSNMTMERDGGNNAVNARTVDLLSSIDRRMAEQNDLLRQIANK